MMKSLLDASQTIATLLESSDPRNLTAHEWGLLQDLYSLLAPAHGTISFLEQENEYHPLCLLPESIYRLCLSIERAHSRLNSTYWLMLTM